MIKILIISYHFPPMNAIASYRARAYATHLTDHGISPTVLTCRWEQSGKSDEWLSHTKYDTVKVTKNKNFTTIRLPRKPTTIGTRYRYVEKLPIARKMLVLASWALGFFDSGSNNLDAYLNFKEYLLTHLIHHRYDVILGIFSPHHHVRLCYEIYERFKIPYIIDFRDLWDNRIIHNRYRPNLKEQIQDFLVAWYWKKWLSKGLFFTITSEPWKRKLADITEAKGFVITNGFEENEFTQLEQNRKVFRIVYIGSLYYQQELDIFLEGVKNFTETYGPQDFLVEFIGSDRVSYGKSLCGFLENPKEFLAQFLNPKFYTITGWKPREEALRHMSNAQVLVFPGFPEVPGNYTGKIFEYLGSRRNILLVPSDKSVVADLITKTKAGQIVDTSDEVSTYLYDKFHEWQRNGHCSYHGLSSETEQYSRGNQTAKLAYLIKQALKNKHSKIGVPHTESK